MQLLRRNFPKIAAQLQFHSGMLQNFRKRLSTGVWCVPGLGAGFEIALAPSELQKEREHPEKVTLFSATNLDVHQTVVQKRSDQRSPANPLATPPQVPHNPPQEKNNSRPSLEKILTSQNPRNPEKFKVTRIGADFFWGRRCDEASFSEKKAFSVKRGEAIQ